MPAYAKMSTDSPEVIEDVIVYDRIVCVCSFGLFLESIWTKVLQANGDMKTPMTAQIAGAVANILIDPLLIFGMFGLPEMGMAGAAAATAAGQIVAALIVFRKGFRKSPAKEVRAESDLSVLFGSGSNSFGAVLQMADLFLHSVKSNADLHRSGCKFPNEKRSFRS